MVFLIGLKTQNCSTLSCKTEFDHFNIIHAEVQEIDRDYNPELLKFLQLETEYPKILYYARSINFELPEQPIPDSDEFCQQLYRLLFNLEIVTAELSCPICEQQFRIIERIFIYD